MLVHMFNAFAQVIDTDLVLHSMNEINIHHNFANLEHHGSENLVVHRKGATRATEGLVGIIPGSMGTHTYIVKGRGSEDSLQSCSHGAGRRMSRTAAKKTITQQEFEVSLKGTFTKPSSKILDEAPGAYKNIEDVMRWQEDLVEIQHILTPILTIKGEGSDN
jgi:tRNA-splicing ligase RtcB